MGWKNCIKCSRYYSDDGSGCRNTACARYGVGDANQQAAAASSAQASSSTPAPLQTASTAIPSSSSSSAFIASAPKPVPHVSAPKPVVHLTVAPLPAVIPPVVVPSSHVLPVISSVSDDQYARSDGAIEIRQKLLDLRNKSIANLIPDYLELLGKGINKTVYRVKEKPWVVAVISAGFAESKWRAVRCEIEQLLELRKHGVTVPSLGPITSVDDALINVVDEKSFPAKAFIEQLIPGNHALCRQENPDYAQKFASEIERVIGKGRNLDPTKFKNAKADLDALAAYFARGEDIPDFQIVVDTNTGHVYTIDPGDPHLTGSVINKHLGWIREWRKVIAVLEPRSAGRVRMAAE
ncbi:hypothetical protein [Massilia sp. CFBP9026]|uniref:hypothetical protein n=1 Tax=Massilia sp. CFBP9026 TaxID=3096536 RepID=UPI002A6A375C|nr:hypothetical protein [Massilia sp. CFBP9026]MDY0965547.1 hypothetical protein [Massilia sp. CFBP9026]